MTAINNTELYMSLWYASMGAEQRNDWDAMDQLEVEMDELWEEMNDEEKEIVLDSIDTGQA